MAYTILLVDASLYPFSGWRDLWIGPFDYLFAPWPSRALEFDMVVNVLGYLPLGLLGVFVLYPKIRGWASVGIVTVGAAALSAALEATQTYLPTRVASKVDLATNIAGALVGAVLGTLLAEPVLDRGRLREVRRRWFARDRSWGLVIGVLWFGAILYPQPFAFACGNIAKTFGIGFDEPAWLGFLREPSARGFAIEEMTVSGCFLSAAGLHFLNLLRPFAPRTLAIFVFLGLSAAAKTLGTGWTYAPGEPFIWITRGAFESGIGAALILLFGLYLPIRWRAFVAQLLLLAGLVLVNTLPENPYFEGAWQDWAHGRLLNFYGLALGVSLAWPFVALAYLVRVTAQRPAWAAPV
ncbi:MAG: VanZ family protein [Burkholderiaceae bacterium]|jgi:VanZ family protein